MTRPTGRAAIEIVGDLSHFGSQIQRDADAALRGLRLNVKPVADQVGKGLEAGVDKGAATFENTIERGLRSALPGAVQAGAAIGEAAASAIELGIDLGTQGVGGEAARAIAGDAVVGLSSARPILIDEGAQMGEAVATGMSAQIGDMTRAADTLTVAAATGLAAGRPAMAAGGAALGNSVAAGMASEAPKVKHSAGLLAATAKTALLAGAAGIGAGLVALTGFGLKSAAALEQTQISFNALTGSAKAGQAVFDELQRFSAATPFEFPEVADAAKRFLAFNQAVGLTDAQLVPFLTTVGDIAAVTGAGAAGLGRVNLALGQMASAGHVTLGDLNQISQAFPGFSGVASIAAAKGITSAEALKLISSGAISAKDGVAALLEGMKQFPGAVGAMEAQSRTLLGVFSTFKDTASQALAGAFKPVIPAIKDSLAELTPVIGEAFSTLAPALGQVLSQILPLLGQLVKGLVPILAPILTGLAGGLKALGPALAPLGDALGTLFAAAAPILVPIGKLAAQLLTALIPAIRAVAPLIGGFTTALSAIMGALGPIIAVIGESLGNILDPLGSVGTLLADLAPIVADVVVALGNALQPILLAIGPIISDLLEGLLPLLPALVALAPPIVEIVVALTPLIELLAVLITIVADAAAPLLKLVAILLEFLASKAIAPLLMLIAQALTFLLQPVQALIPLLTDFSAWLSKMDWAGIGADISGPFVSAWHAVLDFLTAIGHFAVVVGSAFATAWRAVVAFFVGVGQWFTELPGRIGALLAALPGLLLHAFTAAFDAALFAIGVGIGLILAAIIGLPPLILKGLQALPGLIAALWIQLAELFRAGVDRALVFVASLPGRALAALAALVGMLAGWATSLWSTVGQIFSNGIGAVVGFAITLPGRIGAALVALPGIIGGAFVAAWRAARAAVTAGVSAVVGVIAAVPGRISGLAGAMLSAGRALIGGFMTGLRSVGNFLGDVAGSIVSAIRGFMNNVIDRINSGIASIDDKLPISLPRIPRLARGGFTTDEGLAVVHPRELVLPLEDARVTDLLARALAEAQTGLRNAGVQTVTSPQVDVRVFLGTRELTDLVRVEIDERDRDTKRKVLAGVR